MHKAIIRLPVALMIGALAALAGVLPQVAQTPARIAAAAPASHVMQASDVTATIPLVKGWNLIGWAGATMPTGQALAGGPGGPQNGTTDVTASVGVVFGYDAAAHAWHAYFPSKVSVPGANDLTDLTYLGGYFVYATAAANWVIATVPEGQQTTWTVPSSPDPMTSVAVLSAVRMGVHPEDGGWERIVFEFAGPERPQATIEYVTAATGCASGDPVSLPGTAVLKVAFVGADAHNSMGQPTVPGSIVGPGTVVKAGTQTCDFEGHVTWDFGLEGKHNFKVSTPTNPTRVVIDVKQ